MAVYLVDLGNSNAGPIGASARIHAASPEDALKRFASVDRNQEGVEVHDQSDLSLSDEYITVYFNFDKLTVADNILASETEECDVPGCELCGPHQGDDYQEEPDPETMCVREMDIDVVCMLPKAHDGDHAFGRERLD